MNRDDFQKVSKLRVYEAKQLLDQRCYAGSYYLLGYAVECAIKACISKQTKKYDFPSRTVAQDCYTHDLKKLFQTAGLWQKFLDDIKVNQPLSDNWAVVKDWTEACRYSISIPEKKARDFYSACTSKKNGVLSWLKKLW